MQASSGDRPPAAAGVDAAVGIDAVVFDLGGVLLDWDPRHLYRKLFDDEDEMERFLAEICTLQWHAAHDLGLPAEQSCAALAARHPEHAQAIFAWARRSEEMIGGPIAGTVAILRELLDRGVRCYALTNMEAETFPGRARRFEFMRWFAGTVVSGFERIAKPDPAIFRLLLTRFALTPSRTLLIDDSQANVAAARALGIQTILFSTPPELRDALVDYRLLDARSASGTGA